MFPCLVVSATLLAAAPAVEAPRTTPTAADMAAYEAAQASVGRDPDAHVRLALWCEAHGLPAERMKHLAIAVVSNPRHSMARGLLGLVEYRGRWQRPEAISEKAKNDALLAEYRDRRAKTKDEPDAQWDLAVWCDENGLKDEAAAHFTAVIKLDPKRESPWKRLGFKKLGGRWVTDAQLAEEKAEAVRQKEADRRWKPLLEKYRDGLQSKIGTQRAEAESALAAIDAPRAVPMIGAVFAKKASTQHIAVQVLGQIDALEASRALAALAGFSESAEVRRKAAETLKRRDPREYADLLIAQMRDPIRYQVQPVGGPGVPGTLRVEGKRKNLQRQYTPPPMPRWTGYSPSTDLMTYDAQGLPVVIRGLGATGYVGPDGAYFQSNGSLTVVGPDRYAVVGPAARNFATPAPNSDAVQKAVKDPANLIAILSDAGNWQKRNTMYDAWAIAPQLANQGYYRGGNPGGNTIEIGRAMLETEYAAASLQRQLESDVAALENHNNQTRDLNQRMSQLLNDTTGADLPADTDVWQAWWLDQLGDAQKRTYEQDKPTVVEIVTQPLPPLSGFQDNSNGYVRRTSCFGAGTLVHTLSGAQTIESLHEGDRVLTQNMKTGALGYKPILVVHRNPPSPTYRIALGDETVVSSHFHRFWKPGKGWVMARDLAAGDTVRTLGGLVQVRSIDADEVQPVFNLDVADDADFFVGRQGPSSTTTPCRNCGRPPSTLRPAWQPLGPESGRR